MSAKNGDYLGVSPPLSTDPPKPQDIQLNEALMAELKAQHNFESQPETEKRLAILKKLQKLLLELVQKVGKEQGINPELLKEAGGKVFTYGSFRLGVYGPGSDIDTLMVGPKHLSRERFFAHMPSMIRKHWPPEAVTELIPVPDSAVPIIKLTVEGVQIDLIYAALQTSAVKRDLELTDSALLRGLDQTDMRCVNGTRVTDSILKLVPELRVFRIALRAIKLWAQRRAIYGNAFGYPGGVAWGMMVARVCQLYPKAAAPTIIAKFFWVIQKWQWPSPIYLQAREKGPGGILLATPEFDPNNNHGDRSALMPVVTPSYPCMNSTHTITKSTKTVLLRELERGNKIMAAIYDGKQTFKDLFAKHNFFTSAYQHYICVVAAASTNEAEQAWSGWVGAKLRHLWKGIENSDADSVNLIQPYYKKVERYHRCPTQKDVDLVYGGSLHCQVGDAKASDKADAPEVQAAEGDSGAAVVPEGESNESAGEKESMREVWTSTYYLGIELVKGAKNLDISFPIQEFKRIVLFWPEYDETKHSIQIKHVRDHTLPDDLFGPGETKPQKKKKAKKPAATDETADKKRSFADAELDENQDPAKRRQSGIVPGATHKTNGTSTPNGTAG